VTDNAARIGKAGEHILALKPGISAKQVIDRVPRRQHAEYVLDGQASAPNDRLSAEDLWVDRNALEKGSFVHERGFYARCRNDLTQWRPTDFCPTF